jgi:hypothetical protein
LNITLLILYSAIAVLVKVLGLIKIYLIGFYKMKDTNQIVNALIWRLFGVGFLLFIIFRMMVGYQESTTNELGDKFDELNERAKTNLERMQEANKPSP